MTDTRISDLPFANAANASDQFEANQAGVSRRVTMQQVLDNVLQTLGEAVNVRTFGAKGDDAADDYGAIQAAINSVKASPGYGAILIPPGIYRLSAELVLNGVDLHLVVSPGATLKQMTWPFSGVQMRDATRCSVTGGGRILNPLVKVEVPDADRYEGTPARARSAGVYVINSNECEIRDLTIDNFICGVTIRAPDDIGINDNNRIKNVRILKPDFGILGWGQRNCIIDGVMTTDTVFTQPAAPPHGIYWANYALDNSRRQSENMVVANFIDRNNPYSSSFKLLNIRGLAVSNMVSQGTRRGFEMSYVQNATVTGLSVNDLSPDGDLGAGINLTNGCANVEIIGPTIHCIDNWDMAHCILLREDTSDITIRGGTYSVSRTGSASTYPVAINGTRNVLADPVFIDRGPFYDKIFCAFGVVSDGGAVDCALLRPTQRTSGAARLAYASLLATRTRFEIDVSRLSPGYATNTITDNGVDTKIGFSGANLPTFFSTALPISAAFEGTAAMVSDSPMRKNPARSRLRVWYYPDGTTVVPNGEALGYQAYVQAYGGTVSAAEFNIIASFIDAEKSSGAWYRTDEYLPLWGETDIQSRTGLKLGTILTPVASPVFLSHRHWQTDGVANYLSAAFTPSVNRASMAFNDMRMALYTRDNALASGGHGTFSTNQVNLEINSRSGSNMIAGGLNCALSNFGTAAGERRGYKAVSRTPAGVFSAWNNGVLVDNTMVPSEIGSASLPARNLFIGAVNNAGIATNFQPGQWGFLCIGASLSSAQELAQSTAVQAWATSIGA